MAMKKGISLIFMVMFFTTNLFAQVFYKIEGNGLEKPSYIFGTHHMAPITIVDAYDLNNYINQSDQVIGEIDMTQGPMAIAMSMQSHMLAPADSTLSKVIPAEKYDDVNEQLKKFAPMPGIDLTMLEPMKPAAVSNMITVGIMAQLMPEFNMENQLDSYFQTYAQENGKKIVGLETPEFQAQLLFDFTPISVQVEGLLEVLEDPEKMIETAKKLNAAYLEGDLDALLALTNEEDSNSEFTIALLDNRNANWLELLPDLMNETPSFIAVGALHLAGDKGVIEGLRKKGYTVESIPMLQPVEIAEP